MAAINTDTARKVARLARLGVPEEKLELYAAQLSNIIKFVEQLNEVDVANVEPMTSVVTMKMKMRNDVVTDGHYPQKIVANAPSQDDDFFMVPKVVE